MKIDHTTYPILGMSPGNSYFKDEEVRFLVETVVQRFGRVAILIADVPAISTYIAFGYKPNRARRDKAIPQGNLLRNRVRRAMAQLGYTDEQVRIIQWAEEVGSDTTYQNTYEIVTELYKTNEKFQDSARQTTRQVLEGSKHKFDDIDQATETAVHYLLSEIAFLEWAPSLLGSKKVTYVYHKNWPVYEGLIAGNLTA